MQNFISVPFKAESAHGLTNATGIAKFSGAGVVLEFESKIIGLISSGVKEVRLPLNEILDIKFRKGFLKRFAKIEIRTTTVAKMAEIPNENGKITLKLDRDDFERGAEAVERLQRQMTGPSLIDEPEHVPPRSLFGTDEDDIETKEL